MWGYGATRSQQRIRILTQALGLAAQHHTWSHGAHTAHSLATQHLAFAAFVGCLAVAAQCSEQLIALVGGDGFLVERPLDSKESASTSTVAATAKDPALNDVVDMIREDLQNIPHFRRQEKLELLKVLQRAVNDFSEGKGE